MKSNLFKKAGSAVVASAMLATATAAHSFFTSAAADSRYEFEDAVITGEVTVETDASASGGSYLKMTDSGTISLKFNAEATGIYTLTIYGGGIGGAKQQSLSINGISQGVLAIPSSTGFEAIKVPAIKLNEGENTLLIEKSWGWSNFDYLTIETAEMPPITASQINCCDPEATKETQNLMSYLASVYGNHIISGQQEIYQYGPHDFEYEFEYLKDLTDHYPAIRGFDFLNCANILYGSEDGTTDRIIDWVKNKNGIATASWHLTVPKKMAGYKVGDTNITWNDATYSVTDENGNDATDFVTSNVLVEGTVEHEYYMTALKALAEQIQKLQDAGVPLIFRPLHEAEGGGGEDGSWFWWGKEGSAVYKDIWKLTYKTLTEEYDLHNIIWEWNSYNFDTSENWYPGDEYVDIIGYDKYNCTVYLEENNWQPSLVHNDSAISSTFYGIMEKYNSKKMVAMAENDSFSTVDNLTSEKAGWLYFCTWYDGGSSDINFVSDPIFNTKEDTIAMYQSDYCITLDELPADLYSEASVVTTVTTKPIDPSTTTTTVTTTDKDFVFEQKSYKITLPDERENVVLEIEGAATASVGGGLGYGTNADDWINLEWSTNLDKNGKATVEIDISEIPASITSAEIQVWWSNVWDAENEVANDKDCDIVNISFSGTTTEETVYGDANDDGEIGIADVVKVMMYASDKQTNPMTDKELDNADVNNRGDGVFISDALSIQKKLAQVIDKLPESYMDDVDNF